MFERVVQVSALSLTGMWKVSLDFLIPRLCQRWLSNIYSPSCDGKGTGRGPAQLSRNPGIPPNLPWRLPPLGLLCPMGLGLAPAFIHWCLWVERGQSQELTIDPYFWLAIGDLFSSFLILFWLEFLKRPRIREKEVPYKGPEKKPLVQVRSPERVRQSFGIACPGGELPIHERPPGCWCLSEADSKAMLAFQKKKKTHRW